MIFLLHVMLCILFPLWPAFGESSADLSEAENALNHARTFHWLARWKHNDTEAFTIAMQYAGEAMGLLEDYSGRHAEDLKTETDILIRNLHIRLDNNFDTVANMLPLFTLLTGRQQTYEYIDDPPVIALERAVEGVLAGLPAARPDLLIYAVVTSSPRDPALEDEALSLLNRSGRFFARPEEDILDAIGPDRASLLYRQPVSAKPLSALAEAWAKRYIMLVGVVKNDIIRDVYYYGAYFRLFDAATGSFIQSSYSDGFSEDRHGVPTRVILAVLIYLGLGILLSYAVHVLLLFQPRRDRGTLSPLSGPISLLIGGVTGLLAAIASRPLAPEPTALMIHPRSILWLSVLALVSTAAPPVLSFLVGSKTPGIRERTGNANTLAAFMSGGFAGAAFIPVIYYMIRFGPAAALLPAGLLAVTALFTGTLGGFGVFQVFSRNRRIGLVLPAAGAIICLCAYASAVAAFRPGLVAAAGASLLLYGIFVPVYRLRMKDRRSSAGDSAAGGRSVDMTPARLAALAAEPEIYVDPSETGDFIDQRVRNYFSFLEDTSPSPAGKGDPLYLVYLHGGPGTGKTRTARQIARALHDHHSSRFGTRGAVLFGDCDEMNADGSGVPFEPFAQAFHELLGAGRFEPPDKRAAKVARGLKSLGLETALGALGMGALGSLMGLEPPGDGGTAGTSTGEMAFTLGRALLELAGRYDAPVVLILDDLHFIDPLSEDLFRRLLLRLMEERGTRRVVLILTEDPGRTPGTGEQDPADTWKNILREGLSTGSIVLDELWEADISNPARFDDLLTDALYFTQDAANLLLRRMEQYAPTSIMSILQSAARLIQLGGVVPDERTGRVSIAPGFDFTLLPPPSALQKLVMEKLDGLTGRQKNIVECAAFVGYEFKAEILADVLGMDRLVLLQELRILEQLDIIHDLVDQDDIYAFNSTALAAAIRHQTKMGDMEKISEVPQVVREYHHRIARSLIHRMERFEETPETLPLNDLITLARRSFAAGDRMIMEAFTFNSHAARRTAGRGRYIEALTFARQATECASKLPSLRNSPDNLAMKELILEMGTIRMTPKDEMEAVITDARRLCSGMEDGKNRTIHTMRPALRWADYLLSGRSTDEIPPEELKRAEQEITELRGENSLPPLLALRADLAVARLNHAADFSDDYPAVLKGIMDRLQALDPSEDDSNGGIRLRLESEVLEDLGLEYYRRGEDAEAGTAVFRAIELKQLPSVNDTEGILKLRGVLAEIYIRTGRREEALEVLREAYRRAEVAGALKHRINLGLLLGQVTAESDERRAVEYFIRAYHDGRSAGDIPSQARALTGLFAIASRTGDENLAGEYRREAADLLAGQLPEVLRKQLEAATGEFF